MNIIYTKVFIFIFSLFFLLFSPQVLADKAKDLEISIPQVEIYLPPNFEYPSGSYDYDMVITQTVLFRNNSETTLKEYFCFPESKYDIDISFDEGISFSSLTPENCILEIQPQSFQNILIRYPYTYSFDYPSSEFRHMISPQFLLGNFTELDSIVFRSDNVSSLHDLGIDPLRFFRSKIEDDSLILTSVGIDNLPEGYHIPRFLFIPSSFDSQSSSKLISPSLLFPSLVQYAPTKDVWNRAKRPDLIAYLADSEWLYPKYAQTLITKEEVVALMYSIFFDIFLTPKEASERAYEEGFLTSLNGNDSIITRAEFAVIFTRMKNIPLEKTSVWYQSALDYMKDYESALQDAGVTHPSGILYSLGGWKKLAHMNPEDPLVLEDILTFLSASAFFEEKQQNQN